MDNIQETPTYASGCHHKVNDHGTRKGCMSNRLWESFSAVYIPFLKAECMRIPVEAEAQVVILIAV